MRRFTALGAAMILMSGVALAQTTTTTTTTTISPEHETAIRTYVTKQKVRSVPAPAGFTVTTGAVLPSEIEVQTLPADVGVRGYSYATVGEKTVVVGSDRKIIRVID